MSRNGSGVYSPPVNSWNPAVSGNAATPADWQSILNDISAALTQSLSADGQTQLTGNLNANGNKLTNLGAGSASGDTLAYQQLFSQGTEQDVASSATTDIGAINSNFLRVTGTTTITSFGTNYNGPRFLRFASALTLTHSASLVLPGGANIITAAGDSAIAVPLGNPATGWRVAMYERADGSLISNLYALLSGATFTGNVNLPSLNSGQLAGVRNKIINGKMEIAQRGTSFVSPTSSSYLLDSWQWLFVGGGLITATQASDTPADNEFQNSLRLTVTNADAAIAAGDVYVLRQPIEGFNVRDLIGKTFTVSFRVRSSKTGTHCVALANDGGDRSYVAEYTVNAANTWETKSITVPGGLITAGSWNWTNGRGLILAFTLAAGSTFQTTAGAWQTGNFFATSSQVNCLDTIGNVFAITGVQLEVGSVATPFEHRSYGTELALCRRYGRPMPSGVLGQAFGASSSGHALYLDTPLRSSPTLSTTSGFSVSTAGGGTVGATPAIGSLNDSLLYITTSGASSLTAGHASILNAPAGAFLSSEL